MYVLKICELISMDEIRQTEMQEDGEGDVNGKV